jgi:hypothetical protein
MIKYVFRTQIKFCEVIMRLAVEQELNAGLSIVSARRRGRPSEYRDEALVQLIFNCWLERERMCAKRLVHQLESWLQEHEAVNGSLPNELRAKFLAVSAATVDRVLRPLRAAWYADVAA